MKVCEERYAKAKKTPDEPLNLKSTTTLIIFDWFQSWCCLLLVGIS
jgi:hypothetical protein